MGSTILGHGAGASSSASGNNSRPASSFYQKYELSGAYTLDQLQPNNEHTIYYKTLALITFDTLYIDIYIILHLNCTFSDTYGETTTCFQIYGIDTSIGNGSSSKYFKMYTFPMTSGSVVYQLTTASKFYPNSRLITPSTSGDEAYEYSMATGGSSVASGGRLYLSSNYTCAFRLETDNAMSCFQSIVFHEGSSIEVIGNNPIECD